MAASDGQRAFLPMKNSRFPPAVFCPKRAQPLLSAFCFAPAATERRACRRRTFFHSSHSPVCGAPPKLLKGIFSGNPEKARRTFWGEEAQAERQSVCTRGKRLRNLPCADEAELRGLLPARANLRAERLCVGLPPRSVGCGNPPKPLRGAPSAELRGLSPARANLRAERLCVGQALLPRAGSSCTPLPKHPRRLTFGGVLVAAVGLEPTTYRV